MSHSIQEPYAGFEGKVGRTRATSEPWWEPRPAPPPRAPNVVLMLLDDMGFSDLGCFGSEIPTPNLDRIAAEGTRLTNFHVTPMCSPTRAALMTGQNPHMAGVGQVIEGSVGDTGFPGYRGELAGHTQTMAEVFRANGYATLLSGKWHLTTETDDAGSKAGWPLQRGFDRFYGIVVGSTSYHHPHHLVEDNHLLDIDDFPPGYYLTDDLTDHAIEMVGAARAASPTRPFFLYYALNAPHSPLHAKAEDIERYRHTYDAGWDVIRERRFARQKELGIVAPDAVLPDWTQEPAGLAVRPWSDHSARERELFSRYMAVYAAMIDCVDQNVGRLRAALEDLGEWENTIFICLSDNGATQSGGDRGNVNHVRGQVRTLTAGAVSEEEAIDDEYHWLEELGGPRTFADYPRGWGTTSNTPYRLHKGYTYAGGHQVPLIISGPRAGGAGGLRSQYAYVTDILPTLVELTGVGVPGHRNGIPVRDFDGCSFASVLGDASAPAAHREQYYELWGQRGYYREGWMAVAYHPPRTAFADDRWTLHELASDPTEVADLAEERPDVLEALVGAWERAAAANQVFPLDERIGLNQVRPPGEPPPVPLVLRPGMPRTYAANKLIGQRSYRIECRIVQGAGDQGVLFAHGSQAGGSCLYVEDGRLHLVYNHYGRTHALEGGLLAAGRHEVVLDARAPGGNRWDFRLLVDGQTVATEAGLPMIAVLSNSAGMGIDVGLNRASPVVWELRERHGLFPYTGTLETVTIVPGEPAPDRGPRLIEELRRVGLALQ